MDKETQTKKEFVEELEKVFVKYGIGDIDSMYYTKTKTEEEIIVIKIGNNILYVNVNCDSLIAMVADIMKTFGYGV